LSEAPCDSVVDDHGPQPDLTGQSLPNPLPWRNKLLRTTKDHSAQWNRRHQAIL